MHISNDKPEGGSAYHKGRIELIINRRFNYDEGLGLIEALNETDSNHKGLNVSAKYYLQFTRGVDLAYESIQNRRLLN